MEYVLLVLDEIGHILRIPLLLDGSEDDDTAVARFKDAIVVARHMYSEKWGTQVTRTIDLKTRRIIGRLDGFPE